MGDENIATREINKKWSKLKYMLGKRTTANPEKMKYGGWEQKYDKGRIYYHAKTGAHEVHGGILKKYLALGGPLFNPKTGKRSLGYPITDETITDDGVSYNEFEWGAIFWVNGGVAIFNPFYSKWKEERKRIAKKNESKGFPKTVYNSYPLSDPTPIAGGLAVYYHSRCEFVSSQTNNKILTLYFVIETFPRLGAPWIIKPRTPVDMPCSPVVAFGFDGGRSAIQKLSLSKKALLEKLWTGTLQLNRVGDPKKKFRLSIVVNRFQNYFTAILDIRTTRVVNDRTLHDIVFVRPGDKKEFVLFPHAAYVKKKEWKNFGFIHATDIHVNRRTETFRKKLIDKGHKATAKHYVNYNDGFRDLIRYANYLYDRGDIDFIIATGDIVDYQYELYDRHVYDDWKKRSGGQWSHKHGFLRLPKSDLIEYFQDVPANNRRRNYAAYNNFEFFVDLVRGRVPDQRRNYKAEELRVPIFTALGNHDYRRGPFQLHFRLPVAFGFGKSQDHYESYNLIKKEAKAIQGGHKPSTDGWLAAQSVQTMTPSWSRNRVFPDHSYCVSLGKHQLVMLNSMHDEGIIDSTGDALKAYFGIGSDERREFLGGRPRSEGLSDQDIKLLNQSLKKAKGLVIAGVHAQPLGTYSAPHYLRETEHAKAPNEDIAVYIARCPDNGLKFPYTKKGLIADHSNPVLGVSKSNPDIIVKRFKKWNHPGRSYFTRGNLHKYLKKGIGKRNADKFLKICVGQGEVKKPIDLVLYGHGHTQIEHRLGWDKKRKELLYYMDFYTENPSEYYTSWKYGFHQPVHILPRKNTSLTEEVKRRHDAKWKTWFSLKVPIYSNSLNSTSDKRRWWSKHRPLLLQTTCLGPVDPYQRIEENDTKPSPNLQGFRVISIKDDLISEIHNVRLEELRKNKFKMPWEPKRALKPQYHSGTGG